MKRLQFDRVIVITLCVALLSMGIGLAVLARVKSQLVQTSAGEYKDQQALLAEQISDTLSNNLANVQNQLRVMATMPEVQNIDDPERCNAKLAELLHVNQKQVGNLGRVNENGAFVCSVNPAIIGQNASRYGTYAGDLIADPDHQPVLGRMIRPDGTDTLAVPLHVPVYHKGVFRGTLGGAIYFDKFQDGYLRSIKFGDSGHVVIMDDNGDILYHPSDTQNGKNLLDPGVLSNFEPQDTMRGLLANVKAGRSGTFDYSAQGVRKTGLYKAFQVPDIGRNWAVVVTIPHADIDQVVDQAGINRIFIVLVSLFAVTTALLTFVSLRNIVRNIELQRIKDDFISITSHQLRTPATIVKQNLGIVRGGYVRSKKERDKFIDAAYESNENQLSIIENILSVSKLEAGRLQLHKETLDLRDLISRLADDLQPSAAARQQKLRTELPKDPVRLQADPTKLCMVIENLVSNAVKYTPEGGNITVGLSRTDRSAVLTVTDDGQGIDAEDLPQLFQRFQRLRCDEASHVPGTGLGLYLTKKIVEMHGGTISVDSRLGHGSVFTVKLPMDM